MAIKIIREGHKKFKVECDRCNALLSYEIDDIFGAAIRCPCCGNFCYHSDHIKEESEDTK